MARREDKKARFERLAQKRVTEAIKRLRLVGNLANRHNYSYDEEHVRQILDALDAEVKNLRGRFREESQSNGADFRFKGKARGD